MKLIPETIEYKTEDGHVDKIVSSVRQRRILKDGTDYRRIQGRITLPTSWIGGQTLVLLLEDVPGEMKGKTEGGLQYFGTRIRNIKSYNATRAEYGMVYLPGEWGGKKVRCYLLSNPAQFSA